MKLSPKFILAFVLLMLSFSMGGNAMNFSAYASNCEASCQLSESSSDVNRNSSVDNQSVSYDNSQSLTISDVELGFKLVTESNSNNYRLRRIIEINDSLKDVMHKFLVLRGLFGSLFIKLDGLPNRNWKIHTAITKQQMITIPAFFIPTT